MGIAMAKNLQRHVASCGLPALRYTNRTMSRGASLEGLGGVPCDSIAELLRDTDIVFISVWYGSICPSSWLTSPDERR